MEGLCKGLGQTRHVGCVCLCGVTCVMCVSAWAVHVRASGTCVGLYLRNMMLCTYTWVVCVCSVCIYVCHVCICVCDIYVSCACLRGVCVCVFV